MRKSVNPLPVRRGEACFALAPCAWEYDRQPVRSDADADPDAFRDQIRTGRYAVSGGRQGRGLPRPDNHGKPTASLYAVRSEYLQFPLAFDTAATMRYIQGSYDIGSRAK